MRDAELLGTLARYAVLTFVVLIALDQVSVGGDIVRESFLIILAAWCWGSRWPSESADSARPRSCWSAGGPDEDKRSEKGPP